MYKAKHILVLLFLFFACEMQAKTIAGKVIAIEGDVYAHNKKLIRGSTFYVGDTIEVKVNSKAQLRFTDDSLVSLVPDTVYRIDEYSYNQGRQPNKSTTYLVVGGLKKATGAIAKATPENVQIKTPVATIGIRGTYLEAYYRDGDLLVGCTEGLISVSNAQGTILIGPSQSMQYASVSSVANNSNKAKPLSSATADGSTSSSQTTTEESTPATSENSTENPPQALSQAVSSSPATADGSTSSSQTTTEGSTPATSENLTENPTQAVSSSPTPSTGGPQPPPEAAALPAPTVPAQASPITSVGAVNAIGENSLPPAVAEEVGGQQPLPAPTIPSGASSLTGATTVNAIGEKTIPNTFMEAITTPETAPAAAQTPAAALPAPTVPAEASSITGLGAATAVGESSLPSDIAEEAGGQQPLPAPTIPSGASSLTGATTVNAIGEKTIPDTFTEATTTPESAPIAPDLSGAPLEASAPVPVSTQPEVFETPDFEPLPDSFPMSSGDQAGKIFIQGGC